MMKRRWHLLISVMALASYMTFYLAFETDDMFRNDEEQTIEVTNDTTNNTIDNKLSKELHILSYFTFPRPRKMNMGLYCKCININSQLNINITYLGDGNTFNLQDKGNREKRALKHSGKLLAASEYITYLSEIYSIEQQKHSIIILFVDGYDVIFQRNYNYILNQFIHINKINPYKNKVIWSVDNTCWPSGDWCEKFVNSSSNKNDVMFLNAGGWIGYLYDVNLMFDRFRDTAKQFNNDLDNIHKTFWSDQGFYSHHYFQNNSNMILDYNSQMFHKMEKENESLIVLKDNGYYNTKTNSYPSMLHFAGGQGKYFFDRYYRQLIDLFERKNIVNRTIKGSIDITFAKNDGTTRTLKYSEKQMCRKYKDLYY
eukprot:401529_1